MMRKERVTHTTIGFLFLTIGLLGIGGCKESDNEAVRIAELSRQIEPLRICRAGQEIETITLNQALQWHEAHEHDHSSLEEETAAPGEMQMQTPQDPQRFCLGVLTGYQAIRYATEQLFQNSIPKASHFDIEVSGSMSGVWDVMSLYTGRQLRFDGQPQKMDLGSYTFTAKRLDQNKVLVFRLRPGLISEDFFALKNQGATCSDPAIREIKQQALLSILAREPEDCFDAIDES
jgi:hypothetical protein